MNKFKEEIDFFTIFKIVREYKWILIFFPLITSIYFAYDRYNATYTYNAKVIIGSLGEHNSVSLNIYNSTILKLQSGLNFNKESKDVEKVEGVKGYNILDEGGISIYSSDKSLIIEDPEDIKLTPKVALEKLYKSLKTEVFHKIHFRLGHELADNNYNYELFVHLQGPSENVRDKLAALVAKHIDTVKKNYDELIENSVEFYKINVDYAISRTKDQNQTLMSLAETLVADRINFLEEQAKVARELGLSNHMIFDAPVSLNPEGSSDVSRMFPEYLRGYKALTEEINALKDRKNIKNYIVQLRVNEEILKSLEADDPQIFLKNLNQIGWWKEDFNLFEYNPAEITLGKTYNATPYAYIMICIFLSFGFGILLSIVLYLNKNYIK